MVSARIRLLAVVDIGFVPAHARRAEPAYDVAVGDERWFADNIPCQAACPVETDVPRYIALIADGRLEQSYQLNWESNVFPGCLGRVCAHPCEAACRRRHVDAPVSICSLKRVAVERGQPHIVETRRAQAGASIGIVGAGVAGLTAARELARAGHRVAVYERQANPGGMLWHGVPDWRLPRQTIRQEIAAITALGVSIHCGVDVGRDVSFEDLLLTHDALLVAAGCQRSVALGIPGEDLRGVTGGLQFLGQVNRLRPAGFSPGATVVTIGGGYTSIDCARSAVRHGAAHALLAYRRGPADIPVTVEEIEEARREGVAFLFWVSPVRILGEGSRATAIEFIRNRPVTNGANSARTQIEPIPGSEFVVPCDLVIAAIGQRAETGLGLETLGIDTEPRGTPTIDRAFRTSHPRIWAAGDYVARPRNFISAIADGKEAAQSIDRALAGPNAEATADLELVDVTQPALPMLHELLRAGIAEWTLTTLDRRLNREDDYTAIPRQVMPLRPLSQRGLGRAAESYAEVELGFTPELAAEEARRCLQCQLNIFIDGRRCILCNGCVEACPYDCIKMTTIDQIRSIDGDHELAELVSMRHGDGVAMLIDEERCIRCGRCVERCPTGCLSMQHYRPVEHLVESLA